MTVFFASWSHCWWNNLIPSLPAATATDQQHQQHRAAAAKNQEVIQEQQHRLLSSSSTSSPMFSSFSTSRCFFLNIFQWWPSPPDLGFGRSFGILSTPEQEGKSALLGLTIMPMKLKIQKASWTFCGNFSPNKYTCDGWSFFLYFPPKVRLRTRKPLCVEPIFLASQDALEVLFVSE